MSGDSYHQDGACSTWDGQQFERVMVESWWPARTPHESRIRGPYHSHRFMTFPRLLPRKPTFFVEGQRAEDTLRLWMLEMGLDLMETEPLSNDLFEDEEGMFYDCHTVEEALADNVYDFQRAMDDLWNSLYYQDWANDD